LLYSRKNKLNAVKFLLTILKGGVMKKKKLLVGKMKRFKALFIALVMVMFSGQMVSAMEELSGNVTGDQFENVLIDVSGMTDETTPTVVNAQTITDAGGSYSLLLDTGIYTVTPTFAGCSFTPENTEVVLIGGPVSQVNFVSDCECLPAGQCSATADCGVEDDGCGGFVDCGECDSEESCVDNICLPDCIPKTECTGSCGEESDGCGGMITCDVCAPGAVCIDNSCCLLKTDCAPDADCGLEDDGCGGIIDCGECPVGDLCIDNVCDICIPTVECPVDAECGSIADDVCENFAVDCGACDDGYTCNEGDMICEETPGIDCACDDDWKNHGKYVNCVVREAQDLLADGLIIEEEKDEIVAEAAESDCGKK
jgi:hypothetical protein